MFLMKLHIKICIKRFKIIFCSSYYDVVVSEIILLELIGRTHHIVTSSGMSYAKSYEILSDKYRKGLKIEFKGTV